MPEQLPLSLVVSVLANSAIAAAVLSGLSVYLFGRSHPAKQPVTLKKVGWISWMGKLFFSGIVWILLFVLVGMYVFQPLAKTLDESADTQYLAEFSGNQEDGLRILFFQIGRGIVWALLLLPWLRSVKDKRWQIALLSGCVCAG
ncbi:MAG TPA: hypothetical protein VLM80_03745 [Anaerolineales bacterium]|nr:hypothetical protein [Anaerolineales bacterium]